MVKGSGLLVFTALLLMTVFSCSLKNEFENSIYSEQPTIQLYQDYLAKNSDLPAEGTAPILTMGTEKGTVKKTGFLFKDSDGDGKLDPYEDWRLSPRERAEDLVSQMTEEQKAGLLSLVQSNGSDEVTSEGDKILYGIQGLNADGSITDRIQGAQGPSDSAAKTIITNGVRFGAAKFELNPIDQAKYANNLQGLVERLDRGIPYISMADPAHDAHGSNAPAVSGFSQWPFELGLGAAKDLDLTEQYGKTVAQEFRMYGIQLLLGPMADIATEPRWARIQSTIHSSSNITAEHVKVLIQAMQGGSELKPDGIGTVMKHFPGSGSVEEGMDSHTFAGRYSIYPGGNFEEHLKPFKAAIEAGVFGVMALYSIVDIDEYKDTVDGQPINEGTGFSKTIMIDLLRDELGFDGMSMSDWGINNQSGWGHEDKFDTPEILAEMFNAGTYQCGGSDETERWVNAIENSLIAEEALDQVVLRILELPFRLGLFENPYIDLNEAKAFWDPQGKPMQDRLAAGETAMKQAMVLAKNDKAGGNLALLPIRGNDEVYVTLLDTNGNEQVDVYFDSVFPDADSGQPETEAVVTDTQHLNINFVTDIKDADIAVVRTFSRGATYFGSTGGTPLSWDTPMYVWDRENQRYTDELVPVNNVQSQAIGELDAWVFNDWSNVSGTDFIGTAYKTYLGATDAKAQIDRILAAKTQNPNLKVVVGMTLSRPGIVSSFVDEIDALVFDFAATDDAFLDVLFRQNGDAPGGTLPVEIPADDESVEIQKEDLAGDTSNQTFEIGYGLKY